MSNQAGCVSDIGKPIESCWVVCKSFGYVFEEAGRPLRPIQRRSYKCRWVDNNGRKTFCNSPPYFQLCQMFTFTISGIVLFYSPFTFFCYWFVIFSPTKSGYRADINQFLNSMFKAAVNYVGSTYNIY